MFIDALIKVPEKMEIFEPRSEPVEWEREAIERMRQKISGA